MLFYLLFSVVMGGIFASKDKPRVTDTSIATAFRPLPEALPSFNNFHNIGSDTSRSMKISSDAIPEDTILGFSSLPVATTTVYVFTTGPTPDKTSQTSQTAAPTSAPPSITPVTAPSNLISIVTAVTIVLSLLISIVSLFLSHKASTSTQHAGDDHTDVLKLKIEKEKATEEMAKLKISQKKLKDKLEELQ